MINFLTPLMSIFVLTCGLIVGSFLNCLIWRMYQDESMLGRSYCPKCKQQVSWYDNIPVISFLILRGSCRQCHKKISWQYPLVEIMTAILFYLSFARAIMSPQFSLLLVRDWLLIITLIIIFVYDFRWQLVPMNLVWPMTIIIIVLNTFLGIPIINIIFSGLLVGAFFLTQYILTKRKGLGEGDIWLGVLLGISFPSFNQLFLLLFLAYMSGSIVGLVLMFIKKKSSKMKIALGPFLAFGAIITLIWGEQIIAWYSRVF